MVFSVNPAFLSQMQLVAGVVPFDPAIPLEKSPFTVGPITNLQTVQQLLNLRPQFKGEALDTPVDFIRPAEIFVH